MDYKSIAREQRIGNPSQRDGLQIHSTGAKDWKSFAAGNPSQRDPSPGSKGLKILRS
ncbi:MAG: hypothetical protein ACO1G6_10095 [Bacteroidota bacterium]